MPRPSAHRTPWFPFILLGMLVFVGSTALRVFWVPFELWALTNPYLDLAPFEERMQGIQQNLHHLPWLVTFILLGIGLVKRQVVPSLAFGTGVMFAYLGLMATLLFGPAAINHVERLPFDSWAWQNRDHAYSEDQPVRIHMVDDLLQRYDLHGMSRAQVVSLLGEPEPEPDFSEYDLAYWLGPEQGPFELEAEWLVLHMDAYDHVAEHDIVRN